jgi:RNA polymerase subunit RPABC4/transcription elongation factor Spt4
MKGQKECPSCAMMVSEKAIVCPVCKYEFPTQSKALRWLALVLVIFIIILYIFR